MGTVFFTVGCPGAGKSTYADMLTLSGWQKLCMDDFRIAIWGSKQNYWRAVNAGGDDAENAKITLDVVYQAAFDRLTSSNCNVVVANTHTKYGEPEFLKARERRNSVRIVVFRTPYETLVVRNNERPEDDRVSTEYLDKQYDDFTELTGWWMKYADAIEYRG